jgi:hypothetical protein
LKLHWIIVNIDLVVGGVAIMILVFLGWLLNPIVALKITYAAWASPSR